MMTKMVTSALGFKGSRCAESVRWTAIERERYRAAAKKTGA